MTDCLNIINEPYYGFTSGASPQCSRECPTPACVIDTVDFELSTEDIEYLDESFKTRQICQLDDYYIMKGDMYKYMGVVFKYHISKDIKWLRMFEAVMGTHRTYLSPVD